MATGLRPVKSQRRTTWETAQETWLTNLEGDGIWKQSRIGCHHQPFAMCLDCHSNFPWKQSKFPFLWPFLKNRHQIQVVFLSTAAPKEFQRRCWEKWALVFISFGAFAGVHPWSQGISGGEYKRHGSRSGLWEFSVHNGHSGSNVNYSFTRIFSVLSLFSVGPTEPRHIRTRLVGVISRKSEFSSTTRLTAEPIVSWSSRWTFTRNCVNVGHFIYQVSQ